MMTAGVLYVRVASTYLYVLSFQDLGGSPVLFGILSVVNHASEIVAYFFTFQIINKFGHVKVRFWTKFSIARISE